MKLRTPVATPQRSGFGSPSHHDVAATAMPTLQLISNWVGDRTDLQEQHDRSFESLVTAKTERRELELLLEAVRQDSHQGEMQILTQEKDLGFTQIRRWGCGVHYRSVRSTRQAAAARPLSAVRSFDQLADLVLRIRVAGEQVKTNRTEASDHQNGGNSDDPISICQSWKSPY